MKYIFLCLATAAIATPSAAAPAADPAPAAGGSNALISGMMTPFLTNAGVDAETTAKLVEALQFIDMAKLLSLVSTGAFSDTQGGPVNLALVVNNELVQAALVEAKLDMTAIATSLGVSLDNVNGSGDTSVTPEEVVSGSGSLVAGLVAVAMLSAIVVV